MMGTDILSLLIAIAAVWGAFLSTKVFFAQRAEKRPNIRVQLRTAITSSLRLNESEFEGFRLFSVEAANIGAVPVTLDGCGFFFPNNTYWKVLHPFIRVEFPYLLQPGTRCDVMVRVDDVLKDLSKQGFTSAVDVVPFFSDQLSREWRGEPFTIPVDDWMRRPAAQ